MKITKNVENQILELDKQKIRPSIIAKTIGICRKSVYNILERNNININGNRFDFNKKHKIQEDFFENIDSKDKAYFLGWIYSDGFIKDGYFSISLQETDKDILENLSKLISAENLLKYIRRNNTDGYNRKNLWQLKVKRKKMYNDLLKLGVIENKSSTIEFPIQLPKEFVFDFIRGVFDGDGCVYVVPRKNLVPRFQISIVCSQNFASTFKDILSQYNIKCYICKKINTTKVVSVNLSGLDGLRFLYYIYENAATNGRMERKFRKFLSILESYLQVKSKVNYRTLNFFKDVQIFKKFLNLNIDFDTHWRIDTRKYANK